MNLQQEHNLLLNELLDKKYFFTDNQDTSRLELIIRPQCDQQCDYCYIHNYGDKLYPIKHRKNKEELVHNIDILLQYLLEEKKIQITQWEIFGGDLFSDDLWFDVMDLFIKYYSNSYYQDCYLKFNEIYFMMPNNLTFVKDDAKVARFEEYLEKLKAINLKFVISYSTDGLYAIDSREKRAIDQAWFDKTLAFCAKHGFGTHPMISSQNIHNFVDNYDWWIENMAKHYTIDQGWSPMFLPVRNDGWTEEHIQKYIELLNHMIDFRLNLFDGNIYNFAKHLTQGTETKHYLLRTPPSDIISIRTNNRQNNVINCSLPCVLTINTADLTIAPCHRLTYEQFCAGHFIIENDKVVGIEADYGLSSYINITENNRYYRPECTHCEIRDFCMQGCMGSQFEFSGDVHKPVPSVCNLLKAQWEFLINKYANMGILDIILNPSFEHYSPHTTKCINEYIKCKAIQERDKGRN